MPNDFATGTSPADLAGLRSIGEKVFSGRKLSGRCRAWRAHSRSISAKTGVPALLNACPKCSYKLRLGDPGRGRYKLKCPKCATPLELTVFEESGKPPIITERAGTVDLPADPKAVAIPSDVDDPSPPPSSSRPEPNHHNLEAVVASSIDAVSADDHSRPGETTELAQPTIAMSSAFTRRRRGGATGRGDCRNGLRSWRERYHRGSSRATRQ